MCFALMCRCVSATGSKPAPCFPCSCLCVRDRTTQLASPHARCAPLCSSMLVASWLRRPARSTLDFLLTPRNSLHGLPSSSSTQKKVLFFSRKPRANSFLRLILAKFLCIPPFFGVRSMIFSPAALSTQKESKPHLLSTGRTPEYVSWTSSRVSRCPFSKLSWSTAPMLSRSTKKRGSQVSPTQTSQLLLQRRVPPAAAPLSSRAQAALAAFVVLLAWLVLRALRVAFRPFLP